MSDRLPPARFVIGRHPWTLRLDDTGRTADDGNRGATYADRLEVVVDVNLPPSLLRETVAHELVHALWNAAELQSEELDGDLVERIVSHLAPRLVDLLADNPALVAYLADRP